MSDNTARNKEFWSEKAATYDSGFEKTLAQFTATLAEKRQFISADLADASPGKPVRLLDYACGPGTVSKALWPYLTQCRGIDLAPGMVAKYKEWAQLEGLSPEQADAVEGDLHDATPAGRAALARPDLSGFDVAAVGFGAHHFDDPAAVAAALAARLRPGGALLVVDVLPYEPSGGGGDKGEEGGHHHHNHNHHRHGHGHGHSHHSHSHEQQKQQQQQQQQQQQGAGIDADHQRAMATIAKDGFDEGDMRRIFEAAGAAGDFAFEVMSGIEMPQRDGVMRTVFFARGTKPEAG